MNRQADTSYRSEGFLFLTRHSSTQEASTMLHHRMSSGLLTLEIQYVGQPGEGRALTAGMLATVSTEIMQVWGRTAHALLFATLDTFYLNKHHFLLCHVSLAVCILTIVRNWIFIFRASSPRHLLVPRSKWCLFKCTAMLHVPI